MITKEKLPNGFTKIYKDGKLQNAREYIKLFHKDNEICQHCLKIQKESK